MPDVKITVVKRMDNKQLFGDNPPLEFTGIGQCDRLKDGAEKLQAEMAQYFIYLKSSFLTSRFPEMYPQG